MLPYLLAVKLIRATSTWEHIVSLLKQHPWQAYVLFLGLFGILLVLLILHLRSLRRLRRSEFRFKQSLDNSSDIRYRLDMKNLTYDYLSASFEMYSGYSCEEALEGGLAFVSSLIHPDDLPGFKTYQDEMFAAPDGGRRPSSIEYRIRHKDGSYRWVCDRHVFIRDADGVPIWIIGSAADVTARRTSEDALRASESRFKELVDLLPQGIFELDATGRVIFGNQHALRLFGRSEIDLERGLNAVDVIAPVDWQRLEDNMRRTLEGEERGVIEYAGLRDDGTIFPMVTHSAPIIEDGVVTGVRGIVFDISEQRRAEDSLRRSEEKHRAVLEQSVDFIYLADLETKHILEANASLAAALGYTAEELGELTVYDFIDHSKEDINAKVRQVVDGERFRFTDRKYIRRDGSSFEIEATVNCIEYGGKRALLVVSRDVTARKAVEAEIKASEAKYRLLVQSVRAAIMIFSDEGELRFINEYGARAVNARAEDVIGKTQWDLFPKDVADMQMEAIREVIGKGRDMAFETCVPVRRGEWRWYSSNLYPYTFAEDGRPCVMIIAYDVTDYKRSENALRDSEETARALMNGTDDVMILLDLNRNILTLNEAAAVTLGGTPEELVGAQVVEVVKSQNPESEIEAWRLHLEEVIRTRKAIRREHEWNGEWLDGNVFPILGEDGEMSRIAIFAFNITGQRRAKEEILKFKTATDNATFGMAIVSLQGEISYINRCFADMHGYGVEELVGKNLALFHNEEQLAEVDKINQGLRETGSYSSLEVWHSRRDGTVFPALMNGVLIKDSDGNPAYMAATAIDISVRKEVEQALRESEEKYRTFLEELPVGVFRSTPQGESGSVNAAMLKMFGFETVEEMNSWGLTYTDMERRDEMLRLLREHGHVEAFETQHRRKDGTYFWASTYIRAERDDTGEVTHFDGVDIDITDRKRAEEALRESEERYRTLVESAGEAIFTLNRNGVYLFVNSIAAERLGLEAEGLVGKTLWDVFPKPFADGHMTAITEVFTTGEHRINERTTEIDGKRVQYRTSLQPIKNQHGEIVSVLGIARDITSFVQAQKDLKGERDLVRSLLGTAHSLVICFDSQLRIAVFNKECERVTGYSAEEALGKRWGDLFADEAGASGEFGEWVLSRMEANREDTVRAKSGEVKTVLWSASVLTSERSDELTAIVVGQDITERKRTEKALQASEEFNRVVIENSPLGVSVRSSTGRLLSYNAAWKKIWNILGDDLDDYLHRDRKRLEFDERDEYLGQAMDGVRDVYEKGGYLHIPEIETPGLRKGRKRWLSQHFYAIMDHHGEVSRVVILTEDITKRKLAEAKARDADTERYRQAKEIAGGFAHEIRNALFPAEGALMRIMQTSNDLPAGNTCEKYSGAASDAVERAIDITELITLYTRLDSEFFPETVDVCRVLHEVIEANQVRCEDQRVDVRLNCDERLIVKSNRQQLYMVLNNLLLNSLDALTECAQPVILATAIGESGVVKIMFRDNGQGIPEKSLGRVFDAFFSSKPNKGTGLGLATARKIIEMYGGTITVSSEPGKFTRFDLTLEQVIA